MTETLYAHSTPLGEETWEPLEAHLTQVAALAGRFAAQFGARDWGSIAGCLHDWGKAQPRFQRRLRQGGNRVDHAAPGAVAAVGFYGPGLGRMLAYAIAGHHAGLPDGGGEADPASLDARLAQAREVPLDPLSLEPPPAPSAPPFRSATGRGFAAQFFIRMLYSCLTDADYLATEAFYNPQQAQSRGQGPSLGSLLPRLEAHLQRLAERSESPIKAVRAEILARCRAMAVAPRGWFRLTVPTGGGKTLSSLDFALRHAKVHGLERVIYAIPFTSIIEQNAAVFRQALGEEGAVLEHHAGVGEGTGDEDDLDKIRRAAENWDAPVVVTTNVQFFESLFADRPGRCRKLHNIAGAVVILDEAQALPPEYLRPALAALTELVANYRVSVVLCTATQPALTRSAWFPAGLEVQPVEIMGDPGPLFQRLRRTRVEHLGSLSDDDLVHHLGGQEQVLCIVNTRAHARALWSLLQDRPGTRHLSTLMCAAHRRQVLAAIREDLQDGRPCRVVSTSLIEAGVDVDFPVVYRAVAGLDAVAQAAGRCNREGRLGDAAPVYLFQPAEVDPPRGYLKNAAAIGQRLLQRHDDPLSPRAVTDYFNELYDIEGTAGLDRKNILGRLEEGAGAIDFPFRSVGREFRFIENAQQPLIIADYPGAGPVLERLRAERQSPGRFWRHLQPYLVSLYENEINGLRRAGVVEVLPGGMEMLTAGSLYHPALGLLPDEPTRRAPASNLF
ncbi:MAG: CRISPR-associated endonuclease Cas3'' [Magnetococcales bacterium]|nr:CRISPR-associated endonuclease Cas3'' [Magnetococcales bacterium]